VGSRVGWSPQMADHALPVQPMLLSLENLTHPHPLIMGGHLNQILGERKK